MRYLARITRKPGKSTCIGLGREVGSSCEDGSTFPGGLAVSEVDT